MNGGPPATDPDRRRVLLDQLRRLVADAERSIAHLEAEREAEQRVRRAQRRHLTVIGPKRQPTTQSHVPPPTETGRNQ